MAENRKISRIKIGDETFDLKDPNQTEIEFDGSYDASTNKAATVKTVTDKINELDGGTIGTPGAGKTVTMPYRYLQHYRTEFPEREGCFSV